MKSYIIYWLRMLRCAIVGPPLYYIWNTVLTFFFLVGVIAYSYQFKNGLIMTNLTDQVSWGAYIANFTFLVGVAAAAVLLVFPTYVLHREDVKDVVLLGELMAFAAITMCLLFITVDLGRPDRFTHIMPVLGRLNFPRSVLAWDVVVLNGYLFLNLHVPGYLLYMAYKGRKPNKWLYLPFVFVSIAWAVSIHTVTAFLYSGLGGRPFWNTAILAPRFLVSAFAGGPAILTIVFLLISKYTALKVRPQVFQLLKQILMVFLPINMFLFGSEVYKEFYTDSIHTESMKYLFFGVHGHAMLKPYIWASIVMSFTAMGIFFTPRLRNNQTIFVIGCVLTILGIWIEKGMGLIIPGFIPTPLGDLVEYTPSLVEFFVCLGIWSFGALLFTVLAKVAVAIQVGELRETAHKST
ncbi:MAG: Hdr menaquinol oxidoreductase integral membrane subunit [Oligoflexia bacterium]|nr:MAG: Hdr menaquinol oxidoreductase integral membrane subunit [Oligoflexia bacterium]